MPNPQDSIFDSLHYPFAVRRRTMLPVWIKIFCWIFIVFFAITLLNLAFTLLGGIGGISLFGITPPAISGIFAIINTLVYIIKGTVAIALLTEKHWAVRLGLAEALMSITLSIIAMCILPFFGFAFSIRFELLLLIPYYYKLWKIRHAWEDDSYSRQLKLQQHS